MPEREPAPILRDILDTTEAHLARRKVEYPLEWYTSEVEPRESGRFEAAVRNTPGMALVAEHKRRSPSRGDIRPGSDVAEIVRTYERAGAAAISVLTEEAHFHGSLDHLSEARRVTDLPLLRKDFVIDEYQLYEAAAHGADAVLLIVGILTDKQLEQLSERAEKLDLDRLIEAHTEEEIKRAILFEPSVLGINNRDLFSPDLHTDLRTTFELIQHVPPGIPVLSESGIRNRQAVRELEEVGADGVLVGESLMRADDPETKVRELFGG